MDWQGCSFFSGFFWLNLMIFQNLRRMATFSQYAVGASVQAIQDAGIDCYYGESVVCFAAVLYSMF